MTHKEVMKRIKENKINDLLDQDNLVVSFDKISKSKKCLENKFQDMFFR